ncbi:hypothetical protein [Prolixibacter sp. SD074]|jgi:hypothetical protein|uniref:hypothetical protein n=1 Tax=Prolixibacter sp. SD074 TaxID=2652391 RepID=UPI00126CCAF2|nr:hypothetical protein [Prolixibacter sp. SD074]GET29985.1 hypothetical protein SD074_21870 [Prolixibacter sp. SD074]
MEASILLQIIKDDIKILNNLALDLTTDAGLSSDEVEIVLTRARNVVKELELLESKASEKAGPNQVATSLQPPKKVEEKPAETETREDITPKIAKKEEISNEKKPEVKEPEIKEEPNTNTEEIADDPDMELLEIGQETKRKTLGESVSAQRSLNDLIGDGHTEDAYMNRPLKSIREGISLNDRYLFVRELFENSNDKFNETVETLDRAENIQEAVHFLKSNYKWNKSETSQKFLSLVKRRFLN